MSTYAAQQPFSAPMRAALVTLIYVALIPFINWSFTWAPMVELPGLGWAFNPVTVVTGLVLVARDFAQREIGHWVLLAMAVALGLTWATSGGELALASGVAFAVSELVDWAVFTFTRLKLSTRVLLSSALAAPVDTTVFLIGAEAIRDGQLTLPNIVMSIGGKMLGALVIWWLIRRTMERDGPETASETA
ncbi:MAG: VUT family protein [Litorimonas sp.]